ncbi:MAG TPA: helix-turn-helix domain-containing protein, partial [Pseudonocardiaceae bacterium]
MRFRLYPTCEQEVLLAQHCAQARFVWNLAVEQLGYRHHRQALPNYVVQSQQLTEARAVFEWLRAGSQTVQQQALRDFFQAMANWWGGTHRRPNWRKRGRREGFRIVGPQVEKTSTTIAGRYDLIQIEDLQVASMVRSARGTVDQPGRNVAQKAGLNRSIVNAAWTAFATRLEDKAAGRV